MRHSALRTVVDLIVLFVVTAHPVSGQTEGTAMAWTPDKALVDRLATAQAVEGYTIRPPSGYQMQRANSPASMKLIAWVGEAREDGTKPTVMLQIVVPPPGQSVNLPLEQLAQKMLGRVKRSRTNWRQDKHERGVVNGMTFVRIRWTGTEQAHNRKMAGFTYVALDGTSIVQVSSQDFVPHSNQALPLAEASVLTFQKP